MGDVAAAPPIGLRSSVGADAPRPRVPPPNVWRNLLPCPRRLLPHRRPAAGAIPNRSLLHGTRPQHPSHERGRVGSHHRIHSTPVAPRERGRSATHPDEGLGCRGRPLEAPKMPQNVPSRPTTTTTPSPCPP